MFLDEYSHPGLDENTCPKTSLFQVNSPVKRLSLFSIDFVLCLTYNADRLKFCTGLKMTSRSVGTLETFESEDKLFTKHILDEGHGDSTPNEGSVCVVNIMLVGKLSLYVPSVHNIESADEVFFKTLC